MKLKQLIESYISYRQALGTRFQTNASVLRAFGRAIGTQADVTGVRDNQVTVFLAGAGPVTSNWHIKYSALRGFYRYAISRGHTAVMPLPTVLPKRPPPFVPYIYSREELRRLFDATDSFQRQRSVMEPVTVRTILLLLYGTGLRVGEALRLNRTDVDLDNSLLTVHLTKFHKTRLVPFGPHVCRALTKYAQSRRPLVVHPREDGPFFTTGSGDRVNRDSLEGNFQRLRAHAGIRRSDGARYQPRLHDLRHTFAVHRLTSWYQQGANVQKLLHQLSVYLGHTLLASTQVYLTLTPELLQQASARFERYAEKEGGHD
jgi:integrase/recombinase XerD